MLCLAFAVQAAQAGVRPYFAVDSLTFTEPAPIRSILNDWKPPFVGGEIALTHNRIELGARWRTWWFGLIERYDYQLEFAPATAEFLYLRENRLPLLPGRRYELTVDAMHLWNDGVTFGRRIEATAAVRVNVAVSVLRSKQFTSGGISGTAVALADNDYDFSFAVDYFYSRDGLFGRTVATASGQGLSVDLGIDWRPNERWILNADLLDIASRMQWDAAPHTVATASSDTKSFDEQGFVRYDPVVSGFESYRTLYRQLTRKIRIKGTYRFRRSIAALVELEDYEIARFVSAGAGWSLGGKHRFEALYQRETDGLRFRYLLGEFELELSTDRLQAHRMQAYALNLAYSYEF